MNKQMIIDELDQLKSENQITDYAYGSLTNLINEPKKQLNIHSVSKSLPTIIEIDFDGHLKCQIETTDKAPTILKAVNGYGHPVDCNEDKIIINEIQDMFANVECMASKPNYKFELKY